MTTDALGAYTTVTTAFRTYWAANAGAIVGGDAPELRFEGVPEPAIPATHFARFVMQEVSNGQSSFRQTDGQRYVARGLVTIQIFGYRNDPQGYERCRKLAVLAQTKLRRAIDCVWFRNVRINDVAAEQKFWRKNVIAEYTYDEIQTG